MREQRAIAALKRRLERYGIPLETDHYYLVPVVPDTPTWLGERRSSIGASEVAPVLGESHFPDSTPFTVWLGKQGSPKPFDPVHSYTSHKAEPLVAGWVAEFQPGIGRVLPGFMARSKLYPWLHATFDRLVRSPDGRLRPLQLKTSSPFDRESFADGPPSDYLAQEDVECLILDDADFAHLAVWNYGPTDYKLYNLPARKERQEEIVERTRVFYEEHMLGGRPPRPQFGDDLTKLYPGNRGEVKTATDDLLDTWGKYVLARSDLKQTTADMEREIEEGKFAIAEFLGDATELVHPHTGHVIQTWRPRKDGVRVHLTTQKGYEALGA
ncbi:YqaJ viral recombinase family protein [Agromyces sp. NPDC127015]|uniref:YqaJ viral recombinase family protein n=1 Tax=Agromyces sp. NPDC127015 TaxID=3347108 RepID=UPI003665105A